MNPRKTTLTPLTCAAGPFLHLQVYGESTSVSFVIQDITPDDLERVADEYRTALEVHRANAVGTALEGMGKAV